MISCLATLAPTVLVGGTGADTFSFASSGSGPDEIGDFVSGSDVIQILASGFGGGLVAGGSVSLVSGRTRWRRVRAASSYYDTDDGRLCLGR
jgi:Ca2+-binding RTX toxin-like protein